MIRLTIIVIILTMLNIDLNSNNSIKHVPVVIKAKKKATTGHVSFEMLKKHSPYPLLAYTTVVAESGWERHKSNLAKRFNNNTGMTVPISRCNSATLKDTAMLKEMLNLEFKKDYDIYRINNTVIKNKCGDTLVAYINRWAIFVTPEDCAKDIGEYQRLYIKDHHAVSAETYLKRLKELNYDGGETGYHDYWISIYNSVKQHYGN